MLRTRTPGERIETEPELLRMLGVSVLTLRRAMGELEREGIIERRQGSGTFYLGDQPLASKHIAVVLDVDETSEHLSPFFVHSCRAIRQALAKEGLASRPYHGNLKIGVEPTRITSQDFLDDVRLGRVSGMISYFTRREPGWLALLRKHQIPFIDPEARYTLYRENTFLPWAIDLALKGGRRRLAALTWESPTDHRNPFTKGLMQLVEQHDLKLERAWLDVSANGWEPGMGWERFRDIWRTMEEKPDMLIVGDDMIFADVQRAVVELGIRVPEELLVVVKSSNVYPLKLEIPTAVYRLDVQADAAFQASLMKAFLGGQTLPGPWDGVNTIEFHDMEPLLETAYQIQPS